MSNNLTHVCIISTNENWNQKVCQAASTLGLTVKRFASISTFLSMPIDHTECACIFVDYDTRVQDWQSIEALFIERGIRVPAIVVVDEFGMMQTAEAVKQLAHLVATKSMQRGEIIEVIHQASRMQKKIDHRFAVERYHRLLLNLNPRERRIVDLVVDGAPNKQIATKLNLSVKTIERDRQSAYRKLKVGSTAEMTRAVILGDLHDVEFDG